MWYICLFLSSNFFFFLLIEPTLKIQEIKSSHNSISVTCSIEKWNGFKGNFTVNLYMDNKIFKNKTKHEGSFRFNDLYYSTNYTLEVFMILSCTSPHILKSFISVSLEDCCIFLVVYFAMYGCIFSDLCHKWKWKPKCFPLQAHIHQL